jgi:hypothetical protein
MIVFILCPLHPIFACVTDIPGTYALPSDLAGDTEIFLIEARADGLFVLEVIDGDTDLTGHRIWPDIAVQTEASPEETDLNLHRSPSFWTDPHTGRSTMGGCSALHQFFAGRIYLLFPQTMVSVKAAEWIRDMDQDAWLKYVRNAVRKRKKINH